MDSFIEKLIGKIKDKFGWSEKKKEKVKKCTAEFARELNELLKAKPFNNESWEQKIENYKDNFELNKEDWVLNIENIEFNRYSVIIGDTILKGIKYKNVHFKGHDFSSLIDHLYGMRVSSSDIEIKYLFLEIDASFFV